MAGKYSGNLVRTYARPDDDQGNWWPDASHNARGHDDDGTDHYADEHRVPATTGAEYAGSDFPDDVTQAPGILLDTQSQSHDGPAILWPVYSDDQYREQLPGAHGGGADRGHVRSLYAAPPTQAHGEVYSDFVDEGQLIPVNPNTEGAPAILRGINAYPMNNPEREGYVRGVRPGLFRRLRPDRNRRMYRRRYEYDLQPLTERGSDLNVPVDTPSPGAPMYGPVFSSWLPGYMGKREVQPAIWRDPGKVDDSLLSGSPPSGGYDAVLGGDL